MRMPRPTSSHWPKRSIIAWTASNPMRWISRLNCHRPPGSMISQGCSGGMAFSVLFQDGTVASERPAAPWGRPPLKRAEACKQWVWRRVCGPRAGAGSLTAPNSAQRSALPSWDRTRTRRRADRRLWSRPSGSRTGAPATALPKHTKKADHITPTACTFSEWGQIFGATPSHTHGVSVLARMTGIQHFGCSSSGGQSTARGTSAGRFGGISWLWGDTFGLG